MSSGLTLIVPAPINGEVEALNSAETQGLHIEICRGKNPPQNRNNGISLAKTRLVGFTNAHTILKSDWRKRAEQLFRDHPEVHIFGGPQLTFPDEPLFACASGIALAEAFATGAMSQRYKKGKFTIGVDESWLTSANLVCRKEVFDKVRFDERIYPGEDPKFLADAKEAGFVIAYDPELIVYNRRRPNSRALAKQIFEYGRTRIQKDGAGILLRNPMFAGPPAFLVYLALLPLSALVTSWAFVPVALYFLLSIIISFKGAFRERVPAAAFVLPWIFLVIHLSYGAGVLYGIAKHGRRSLRNSSASP